MSLEPNMAMSLLVSCPHENSSPISIPVPCQELPNRPWKTGKDPWTSGTIGFFWKLESSTSNTSSNLFSNFNSHWLINQMSFYQPFPNVPFVSCLAAKTWFLFLFSPILRAGRKKKIATLDKPRQKWLTGLSQKATLWIAWVNNSKTNHRLYRRGFLGSKLFKGDVEIVYYY